MRKFYKTHGEYIRPQVVSVLRWCWAGVGVEVGNGRLNGAPQSWSGWAGRMPAATRDIPPGNTEIRVSHYITLVVTTNIHNQLTPEGT